MRLLYLIILNLLIISCATQYQPKGSSGGYYHQKVSENAYIVGFSGNGFTNKERTNDFALLRAAEIGEKLGFTHFVVEGNIDKSKTQVINTGSTTTTTGNVYSTGNYGTYSATTRTTNNVMPVYKPGTEIGVIFSEGKPKGRHLEIYEITNLISALKEKYKLEP